MPTEPDSTAQRRDLLATLLSRFERGVITDAERPLLRPLVEAEMAHGQATIDQFTADAPWLKAAAEDHEALRRRFEDLRDEARLQGDVHERTARCLKRVRSQAADWSRLAAPGDVGMTPAVAGFAEAGRIILGISDEPAGAPETPALWTPERPADATITDWATSIDEQCPAHYQGDSPHLTRPASESVDYRCERRGHGPDSDHAARQGGDLVFCWTDAIAVHPTAAPDWECQGTDGGVCSGRACTKPECAPAVAR